MKKCILFLCIIAIAFTLSAFAQEDTSKSLSRNNVNSLPVADMSSDVSATPYVPSLNNLEDNPELELKLRKDYFACYEKLWSTKYDACNNEIKLENISVQYYFGTVNNCEIALMPRFTIELANLGETINVADYKVGLTTHTPLLVHCGSEFYKLEDAYEKGILTKENVYEIGKLVEELGWGTIS